MSEELDRNPPPPPEILSNDDLLPDRIGNSVYSKQWLFKTLLHIVEWSGNTSLENRQKLEASSSVTSDGVAEEDAPKGVDNSEDKNEMVELDPQIEEDACMLWDMTASKEVAVFLNKPYVTDIFLDIVDKTKSPRLLEIIVGILGNMSSVDSVCQNFSQIKRLLYSMIMLTGTTDAPTLLQVTRVIRCGICNKNSQDHWFNVFQENSFVMENMKFIFENSLSSEVLNSTFKLLNSIFNENPSYCKIWGQRSYTKSIIEAGKQLLNMHENLDLFFSVLESLCQYTPNVKELVENDWANLSLLHNAFLLSLGEEEVLPAYDRIAAITSCFNIYETFLGSENINHELVKIDINMLKAMRKISRCVSALVSSIKQDNLEVLDAENPQGDHPHHLLRKVLDENGFEHTRVLTEYEFDEYNDLAKILIETARSLKTYAEKDDEQDVLEDILNSEGNKENIGGLIT